MAMSFTEAAEKVRQLKQCSEADMEILYGLYKQATCGDNNREKPPAIKVEDMRKWKAWESRRGMSKEEAEKLYVEKAQSLLK